MSHLLTEEVVFTVSMAWVVLKKPEFNRGLELGKKAKLFVPIFQKRFSSSFSSQSSFSHESRTSGIPETKASGFQSGKSSKTQVQKNF